MFNSSKQTRNHSSITRRLHSLSSQMWVPSLPGFHIRAIQSTKSSPMHSPTLSPSSTFRSKSSFSPKISKSHYYHKEGISVNTDEKQMKIESSRFDRPSRVSTFPNMKRAFRPRTSMGISKRVSKRFVCPDSLPRSESPQRYGSKDW